MVGGVKLGLKICHERATAYIIQNGQCQEVNQMGIYSESIINIFNVQPLGRISLVFLFGVEIVKGVLKMVFGYRRCKHWLLQEIYL